MNLFVKKPVVVHAVQFDGTLKSLDAPGFFIDVEQELGSKDCQIRTPEGVMTANPGDWIIRGVDGEFYPCKPHIFSLTYELVS